MKNKKTIIGLSVSILIVAGLIFWSRSVQNKNSNYTASLGPSTLQTTEQSFDFGALSMAAGKVSHTFAFKNTGPAPVVVKSLYTSCMCTEANLIVAGKKIGPFGMSGMAYNPVVNETVPGGASAEVEAVFDPAAHGPAGIGHIERQIVVQTADNHEVVFNFQAQVNP